MQLAIIPFVAAPSHHHVSVAQHTAPIRTTTTNLSSLTHVLPLAALAKALLSGVTFVADELVRSIILEITKIHDGEEASDMDVRQLESTAKLQDENTPDIAVAKHKNMRKKSPSQLSTISNKTDNLRVLEDGNVKMETNSVDR